MIVGKKGVKKFDRYPWNERSPWQNVDLQPAIDDLNNSTSADSSIYGETWSSNLFKILSDNEFLESALAQAQITETFEDDDESQELLQISKLIQTATNVRGVDRDLFFARFDDWDHHSNVKNNLSSKFETLNKALSSFWNEMATQGNEDKVTLVITSDFGRTLTPNSKDGSDHGWGGNYFMMGGQVKGGQILGQYPDSYNAHLDAGRGRMIPTTPWDAVWYGISEWMGVEDTQKLHHIVPGRQKEIQNGEFFSEEDLFKTSGVANKRQRRLLRQKN